MGFRPLQGHSQVIQTKSQWVRVRIWTKGDGTWLGSVENHPRSYLEKAEMRRRKERTVVVELQVNFCTHWPLMLT